MTHIKGSLALLLAALVLSPLHCGATPPTKQGSPTVAPGNRPDASQRWLTVEEVELAVSARVRIVVLVDGAPDILYPTQQEWSDGRATERFLLPIGKSSYTFQFEATLSDGTRTIVARASEPFILDSSKLPVTRQYIPLYPRDSGISSRGAVARLVFSVEQYPQLEESSGSMQLTIGEVVDRLETLRDSVELGLGETVTAWQTMDEDVARVKSELAKRLKVSLQDTQALLLWARAGFHADSLPTPELALDRVLAAEPRNTEALYYKGRIYGAPVQAGIESRKRGDLNRAIPLLRQAMVSAPDNPKYRRALALFLADQGHNDEARTTASAAGGSDPMAKLIEDLTSIPIPEGAEYYFDHPLWGAYMMALLNSGTLEDYIRLRIRLYRISKSPADISAFYAARIAGFQFLPADENPSGDRNTPTESDTWYAQFLRMSSGAIRPSRGLKEIPDPKKREPGILMLLIEMRNDPDLGREMAPGEYNCYLLLVNSRK